MTPYSAPYLRPSWCGWISNRYVIVGGTTRSAVFWSASIILGNGPVWTHRQTSKRRWVRVRTSRNLQSGLNTLITADVIHNWPSIPWRERKATRQAENTRHSTTMSNLSPAGSSEGGSSWSRAQPKRYRCNGNGCPQLEIAETKSSSGGGVTRWVTFGR